MRFPPLLAVSLLLVSLFSTAAMAANDWSSLPKKKQTSLGLYLLPKQAFDVMKKDGNNTLFLDIRSRAEVNFLGTPTVADANVPYMEINEWYTWNSKKHGFKMEVNSDFADAVAARLSDKGLNKNSRIILMCRSGDRSAKAADLLAKLGYEHVYSVTEGFEGDKAKKGNNKGQRIVNGWKNAGLPWSYQLAKSKMYKVGG